MPDFKHGSAPGYIKKEEESEIVWLPEVCGPRGPYLELGSKWGGYLDEFGIDCMALAI